MEITEHIDALRLQGTLLADAAERAGLDAAVPPCPSWQVKDLLRHTGYIHRWAARHLTERPAQILDGPVEAEILAGGAADGELLSWFLAGHAALVQTLQDADPDLDCPAFMPAPSPLAFWARRQAHETAIHRADAESAAAAAPVYSPEFAADGIDELIMGFGRHRKYQPAAGVDGGRLRVAAADTGDEWLIDALDGRMQPRREDAEEPAEASAATSACTVRGPANAVYLYLWNRADAAQPGVAVTGNADLLACWQSSVRVRWG
ncbi:MAG: maleylpyruvate isomerase family mycothiol-dependent enzyme [Streptosporangiaceae bacterium]